MIFGNLGKMGEMLKAAKQMKDALSRARFEGEAGGVRAVVNGEMDLLELKIPPGANESLVKDAVNRALKTAKAEAAKMMSKMTGGLNLPGLT